MALRHTLGVAEKDDLWPVPKVQDQKPAWSRFRDAGQGKVPLQPVLPQLWDGRALTQTRLYMNCKTILSVPS